MEAEEERENIQSMSAPEKPSQRVPDEKCEEDG
jgi:hypothetical protein